MIVLLFRVLFLLVILLRVPCVVFSFRLVASPSRECVRGGSSPSILSPFLGFIVSSILAQASIGAAFLLASVLAQASIEAAFLLPPILAQASIDAAFLLASILAQASIDAAFLLEPILVQASIGATFL